MQFSTGYEKGVNMKGKCLFEAGIVAIPKASIEATSSFLYRDLSWIGYQAQWQLLMQPWKTAQNCSA
jgi:hypothetical protein